MAKFQLAIENVYVFYEDGRYFWRPHSLIQHLQMRMSRSMYGAENAIITDQNRPNRKLSTHKI